MPIPLLPRARLAVSAGSYSPGQVMAAHADLAPRLSIVIAGRLRESVGSRDEYAAAGSLAIKPGHVVHRNLFGPEGARVVSIELPDWLADEPSEAIVGQWRWLHGGPLALGATRLWLAARQATHRPGLADLLVELIVATADPGSSGRPRSPPGWLNLVRQQLADEAARGGHSLSTLAAEAGVHPVHLARMFRRHFRCSVSEYAQALRLTGAVERMATTAESLVNIAAASGYADQSHLSRSCRRGLGLPPRQCRALLAAG